MQEVSNKKTNDKRQKMESELWSRNVGEELRDKIMLVPTAKRDVT